MQVETSVQDPQRRKTIARRWLVGLAALAGLAVILGATTVDSNPPPNGRYFLFQARYKSATGKGEVRLMDNELLRIDTATGKVWRYLGGPEKGHWLEMD